MRLILSLVFLLLIGIFTNFYNLEMRHGFAWDQERDAEVVFTKIIKEHSPVLIGPSVASEDGFYLGPLYYYLLVPFYFIFNGNPIAGPVLTGFVGLLNIALSYFASYKIFKKHFVSFLFSLFIAFTPSNTSWNVMYLPIISLLMYWFCIEILKRNYKFITYGFILAAISLQFHFSAVFLVISLAISIILAKYQSNSEKKAFLKYLLLGSIIFVASFLPLVIFDLRHDFINSSQFLKYFFKVKNDNDNSGLHIFESVNTFVRSISFLPSYINTLIIVVFVIKTIKLNLQNKIVNLLWIFLPAILFSFYRGSISEYYFVTVSSIVLMYFFHFISNSFSSKTSKWVISLVIILLLFENYKNNIVTSYPESLYHKKQIVKYLINQKDYEVFNVSYTTTLGTNTGFGYLFKYFGKEPQDIPEGHLYTIVIPSDKEDVDPIFVSGGIGVIRR